MKNNDTSDFIEELFITQKCLTCGNPLPCITDYSVNDIDNYSGGRYCCRSTMLFRKTSETCYFANKTVLSSLSILEVTSKMAVMFAIYFLVMIPVLLLVIKNFNKLDILGLIVMIFCVAVHAFHSGKTFLFAKREIKRLDSKHGESGKKSGDNTP
jgi:hypothetical protein